MLIKTEITLEDWAAFVRYVRSNINKFTKVFYFASMVLAGGTIGMLMGKLNLNLASFFLGLFLATIIPIACLQVFARSLRPDEDGCVLGPRQIEVAENGLRVSGKNYESVFHWPLIRKVKATKKHIFMMVDRNAGIIVPLRAFASDEERERFIKEIQRRTGERSG
jgi:hypothetical protein